MYLWETQCGEDGLAIAISRLTKHQQGDDMKRMVAGIAAILMFATAQAFGQQYIAVLICGDGPDASMQNKLESELLEEDKDRFAMWNDVFTMRRALVESGYQESDIYVLFKDGSDY